MFFFFISSFLIAINEDFANNEETADDGFMITRAVLITMSVAFAYIILVVGLMLWCRCRRRARKARLSLIDKEAGIENGNGAPGENMKMTEIEPCLTSATKLKKQNGHNASPSTASADTTTADDGDSINDHSKAAKKTTNTSTSSASNYDQISMSRTCLFDLMQIGGGDFGDVFTAKVMATNVRSRNASNVEATTGNETNNKLKTSSATADCGEKSQSTSSLNEINALKEPNDSLDVLVKALNKVKNEWVCIEFRRQIEMFRAVSHKSVTALYGLCRDKDPHYLVLEYTDLGDLKQYLRQAVQLKPLQLLNMAWQVARGMDAIYRARYIHKDLAARNCLIVSNMDVKISYPALTRDTYASEYYKHNNMVIPLRWMAAECVDDDEYSTKSDVFAYGMFVWELFTAAAAVPMDDLSNEEYLVQLKDNRLKWPLAKQTPPELVTILVILQII